MEFLDQKGTKFHSKMLQNAMRRKALYRTKLLVFNHVKTQVRVGKIKNQAMLLKICGLSDNYEQNLCFLMLAQKFCNSLYFKRPYMLIYCSPNWRVKAIVECMPNQEYHNDNKYEYLFVMPENLVNFLGIKIDDYLRI